MITQRLPSRRGLLLAILLVLAAIPVRAGAQDLAPVSYRVRVPQPDTQYAHVEALVPTGGRATVELMMPVWSPGYYRVEDYAARVDNVVARGPGGEPLVVEKSRSNRWRVTTGGHVSIRLTYRLLCNQRTVTTNEVTKEYGVFNGAAAFMTLVENARRAHEVQFDLPVGWTRVMTGLEAVPGVGAPRFRAADYETLVDSPILAGNLAVREFIVDGKPHDVVSAGNTAGWDGDAAVRALETYVQETHRFWGFLPYERYVFLLVFREGGGGLEHKNSTLCTVAARPGPGPWPSLGLLAHEHFHLYNAKRLRPVEPGTFDFEKPPTTGTLWIAEGVTSYYSTLPIEWFGLRFTTGEGITGRWKLEPRPDATDEQRARVRAWLHP